MERIKDMRSTARILAIAAAAVLMVIAMSISVRADDTGLLPDGVDYTTADEAGNTETKHLDRGQFKIIGVDTPKDNIKMKGPQKGDGQWYVVYGGGSIFHRIEVEGVVNLLLMNDTELDCKEGFHVRRGNNYTETLNIYAQGTDPDSWGKLKATGGAGQAAIGANRTVDIVELGGTISIYGGNIEVTGGAGGAGIGGGRGVIPASGKRYGGDGGVFNLYGGHVIANGGPSAAAIGGGYFGNSGTITIYGGSLDARGGVFGAGIGGGRNMELSADYEHGGSAENVTIKGGTVRAYGGEGAAGIGAGLAANGSAGRGYDSEADKRWIKIEGGDVYAEGGEGGAGIGGGIYKDNEFYENGAGANVMISGGRVTARGGAEAAGIGATRSSTCGSGDTIIKGNAKVTAYGGDYAAGIGTGNEPMGLAGNAKWNKIYNIRISEQAEVRAFGGKEAAGIGAGNEGQPSASVRGNLKISGDARVEAYGGKYGAGIGGGDKNNNGITEISGGTVIATGGEGGAGIGGGDNAGGSAGKVTISGGTVNAFGGYKAAGIGGGDTADMKCELEVTGGKVTAMAGEKAAGIGGGNHTFWNGGGNGGKVTVNLTDSSAEGFVFAVSGNSSSSPVGHGDAGDSPGNLTIGDRMSVKAGNGDNYDKYATVNAIKPEACSNRVNVTQNKGTMSALIQYCSHSGSKYTYLNEQHHQHRCSYCGLDAQEAHIPDGSRPCTKCNYGGEVWTVTLKEGIDGNYSKTLKVARGQSTHLPDCDKGHIPSDREFIGWVTEADKGINYYDFSSLTPEQVTAVKSVISSAKKPGSEITPRADSTYYALYIPEAKLVFDANGGSGSMSPVRTPLFSGVKLPSSILTPPSGKEFDKWTIDGTEYAAGEDYSVDRTVVQASATWKDHKHDFDYEGAHQKAVTPSCLEPGCVEFWKCETCERYYADAEGITEIAESDIELSPTGHNYDEATYTWSDDNKKATAKQVCLNDPEHHFRDETVDTESYVSKAATCSEEGVTYYYAQFSNPVFKFQSKKVTTPKTAHAWSEWQRVTDGRDVETRSCSVCGATEERAAGHIHSMTYHPAVEPQCVRQGKKEYWSCGGCGRLYADEEGNQEIDRSSLGIPATGHKYVASSSEEIKAAECEKNGVLRVTKVCEHDANHKITEYPDIPPLGHDWNNGIVKKAATCTEAGEKEYVCLNDPSHTRKDIIAPLGHDWTEWSSAAEDGIKYKKRECTRCGETQKIADEDTGCAHEVKTVAGKTATCEKGGTKDHYECKHCGVYLRKNDGDTYSPVAEADIEAYLDDLIVNRLGHDWGEPTYTWSADNSSVTAKRICKRDPDHTETETVETTSEITREASCETKGETGYSAEFENKAFEKQTKAVEDIDAKGHSWSEWSTVTEGKVTYDVRSCGSCGAEQKISRGDSDGGGGVPACTHAKKKTIPAKEPTCTESGYKEYYQCENESCRVYLIPENGSYTVLSKDNYDECMARMLIPPAGHDWTDPEYSWADDFSSVTATRVCRHDGTHQESEAGSIQTRITKRPTETEDGEKLFTAMFENEAFEPQTKTVVIPKLGPEPAPEHKSYLADGQLLTVDGSMYKVLSAKEENVTLVKAKSKKSFAVPAEIRYQQYSLDVTQVSAKAFKAKKIRTVTLGRNVKKLSKNAFRGSKAKKLVVRTKALTKKSVKGSLKGSKIKRVKVKVGKKKLNRKYVKKYKKIFTKKNAGKKVSVK